MIQQRTQRTQRTRQRTILYAEDDDDAVTILRAACKNSRLTHPIHVVTDGAKAMEYLGGEGRYADRDRFPLPSLLLLDLKMPRKNGFDVLSWIRSGTGINRLPVIFFSTSADPSDINRAYDLGANSYAVKPSGIEGLVDLLNYLEGWWMGVNEVPRLEAAGCGYD